MTGLRHQGESAQGQGHQNEALLRRAGSQKAHAEKQQQKVVQLTDRGMKGVEEQLQGGVSRDSGQGAVQAEVSGDKGKQVQWASGLGEVPVDSDRDSEGQGKVTGDEGQQHVGAHPVMKVPVMEWCGSSRRVVTGFKWDSHKAKIVWVDRTVINPVTVKEQEEEAEAQKDKER